MTAHPRMSEIEGYLIVMVPRWFEDLPALHGGGTFTQLRYDLHVLAPPRGENHQAVRTPEGERVLPAVFRNAYMGAAGIVTHVLSVNRPLRLDPTRDRELWSPRPVYGRPYRFELRMTGEAPRRRRWALEVRGGSDLTIASEYIEGWGS